MQTGAMTMKSRMTVTEALKERELLKKRITKKIGRLGREAGTDGAFAERRSARFDASRTGRKQAQSAVSGNIGHGAVSDGTSAHLDAALQQIRALILRYDSICSAVARSNGETWLDTSRGYMTVSEAVALRSRLNDKETADTAFEQLLTNRLESILKKQKVFSKHGQNPSGRRPALKGNVVILQNPSAGRGSAGQEKGSRADAGQLKPPQPILSAQELSKLRSLTERIQESREELLLELDTKLALSNAATSRRPESAEPVWRWMQNFEEVCEAGSPLALDNG